MWDFCTTFCTYTITAYAKCTAFISATATATSQASSAAWLNISSGIIHFIIFLVI
jgi:hypothetical protein